MDKKSVMNGKDGDPVFDKVDHHLFGNITVDPLKALPCAGVEMMSDGLMSQLDCRRNVIPRHAEPLWLDISGSLSQPGFAEATPRHF